MSKGKQSAVCLQTAVLVEEAVSSLCEGLCTEMNQRGSEGQDAGTVAYRQGSPQLQAAPSFASAQV